MDVYAKQAMELVEWMTQKANKPVKNVAILYVDQAALATAGKITHDWATQKGLKIVFEDVYPMGTTEFSSIMTRIKAAKPDMLFCSAYTPDAIAITRAMKEMNVNVDGLVSAIGGHYTLDYMKTLGADSNYTINAGVYAPDLRVPNLPGIQERYKKRFGYDMDGTDAVTFDAAQVIIDGLERAGSTDGLKLRDAIRATEFKVGTGYYILPDGCKFDAVGENIWQRAVAFQIQNQKWVSIYPEKYAAGKPIWPRPKWSESK
jgi:branched-chain amino acid transport system substrate-binding protein